MSLIVSRAIVGASTYASVVTSPARTTCPVVTSVSTATRLFGSSLSSASRTASEIWSATLSGWPIVTDSLVNRWVLRRNCGDTSAPSRNFVCKRVKKLGKTGGTLYRTTGAPARARASVGGEGRLEKLYRFGGE